MIEKMKFLRITGPKLAFDNIINVYLNKYDIQLENALSELSDVHDLKPFVDLNPYKDLLTKSEELIRKFDKSKIAQSGTVPPEKAAEIINSTIAKLTDLQVRKKDLKEKRAYLDDSLRQLEPFRHLDFEIDKILNLKFIKFRFGKIQLEYYDRFSKYVYENLNTLFYECERDHDYVWGVYFVSHTDSVKIDAIYASLHFERIKLPNLYEGTTEDAYNSVLNQKSGVLSELADVSNKIKDILREQENELIAAYNTLNNFTRNFDVRKLAACTKDKGNSEVFFILCGWIAEKDADNFVHDIEKEPNVYCMVDDVMDVSDTKPPTKLKNPKLFKPFEMFIKMYGFPAYNEIDPTSFVAITYSLIFGIMFGDVGQGLCLVIGGALLYFIKKMNIAAIISFAGVFSTIFGFLYGSIFGFEDLIPAFWLSPMHNVMTVLLTAVGFGVFLIIVAMIINIINGLREKKYGKVLFDTNGVSGLLFYGMAITCVLLIFSGHPLPATILLIIFFALPLLLIFFREPLTHVLEKKKKIFPEHKGMFFVESTFELFEVVLSYVTNTISFLRVGAFALSHAAMMGVVMLLAGVETGDPNIFILIFGNIFVAAMEGLIVGIQVLRLEYYEMFSRFYRGTGKEFKPYKNNKK
ncbi:MAG: V-type ATPase kDa subunit [Herbinix sp.]|nr:V-type ATPase kDa subunit [Herbinix sp.]